MPSIDISFLLLLKENYKDYPCFIETGTYLGETIWNMNNFFNELYTIEIQPNLYESSRNKYKNSKINFLLGDSSDLFEQLLPKILFPTIFFLDGHYSSGITGKGKKDCPILEELSHINKYMIHKSIIIIDDCRLFGKKIDHDWENITKENILNILSKRVSQYYFLQSLIDNHDRMIIHLDEIK